MNMKKRIGFLKSQYQDAKTIYTQNGYDNYEIYATRLYGLLRESWEKAVEEILLHGVVTRFGSDIQTQKLKVITDITEKDIQVIDAAMTKCSMFICGHDQAPAINEPLPKPEELINDILEIEKWVDQMRKYRKRN